LFLIFWFFLIKQKEHKKDERNSTCTNYPSANGPLSNFESFICWRKNGVGNNKSTGKKMVLVKNTTQRRKKGAGEKHPHRRNAAVEKHYAEARALLH
jgi:hypothetical protein